MRPSDHHITPLPSTVNPENPGGDVGVPANPQLINGGSMWGNIADHPPALPPSGGRGAPETAFGAGGWGKVGNETMPAHGV